MGLEKCGKTKCSISVILSTILMAGCSGIALPKISTPKKPETVYNWHERSTMRPKAVVSDGKVIVVEETERVLRVGLEQTPRKLSFAQKIGNWISGLGILGILALIAGLILAPGATLAFLVKLLRKWRRAARETIVAIKESGRLEEDEDLRNTLRSRQSTETKKIVDDIKREA